MAYQSLDDPPSTPPSDDDLKECPRQPRAKRGTRAKPRPSLMPFLARYSAVAVYPARRNPLRDLARAFMSCLQHCLQRLACLGGNAQTTGGDGQAVAAPPAAAAAAARRVKGKAKTLSGPGPSSSSSNKPDGKGYRNSKLFMATAPPLSAEWQAFEQTYDATKYDGWPMEQKHEAYTAECRADFAARTAPGQPHARLANGIAVADLHVPMRDGERILVQQYTLADAAAEPDVILVYYHGGGLLIGDADSEQLSFRRFIKDLDPRLGTPALYSVQYRRKRGDDGQGIARVCVDDSIDAYRHLRALHAATPTAAAPPRFIVIGSSSGGELAALVSQDVTRRAAAEGKTAREVGLVGVMLRCPVIFDSYDHFYGDDNDKNGGGGVPADLHNLHNSTRDASYESVLLRRIRRAVPRDGLDRMPGEARDDELAGQPRVWIQACADTLYSDAVCYKELLDRHGVDVRLSVVPDYPHTFWLIAPQLQGSVAAEDSAVAALNWLAEA